MSEIDQYVPPQEAKPFPVEEALKAANAEIIVMAQIIEQQKEMLTKYIDLSQRLAAAKDTAVKVGQTMFSALQVIAMTPHAVMAEQLGENWAQAIAAAATKPPPPPAPVDQTEGMEQKEKEPPTVQ